MPWHVVEKGWKGDCLEYTVRENYSESICILLSVLGYFDPLKVQSKVMPHPWLSGYKRI